VRLSVGKPLVLARELHELPLDLLFLREHTLLDLQHRLAPVCELGVDLRSELDGLLPRLDLGLATNGFGLALGVLDQLAANPPGLADTGRAERLHGHERERCPDCNPGGDSDHDLHVQAPRSVWVAPTGIGPAARIPKSRSVRRRAPARHTPAAPALPRRVPPSSASR